MNHKAKQRALPWDGRKCPYCGRAMKASIKRENRHLFPTRDHVIPKSRGGTLKMSIRVCWECNGLKGNKDPFEWIEFIAINRRDRLDIVCRKYAEIGLFRDGVTGADVAIAARQFMRTHQNPKFANGD